MITVIGSLKGGSGKSTVTFNLAVWLAAAGVSLRVIDLDPQATLRDVADIREEEQYDPPLRVEGKEALDDPALSEAKEVLIDVGTADLEAMKRAISMADRVVVPVQPSQADIWSTQRFVRFVLALTEQNEKQLDILGFINRADTNIAVKETEEAASALVSLPHLKFLKPRLAQRTLFRRSFSEGLAVFEMLSASKGSQEFRALAAKLYPRLLK